MEAFSDFKALQNSVTSSLVAVTRTATQISSEDLGFHRSLDQTVATHLDQQNARILGLAERLLGNAASNTEVVGPHLPDFDAVDGNWRGIVDVVDSLLEKADISLDEFTGAVKRLSPSREQTPTRTTRPSRITSAMRAQDISKPQLLFQHVPTNAEKEPFKPLLTSKPHSKTSLADSLVLQEAEDGVLHYPHPYKAEIEQYEFPSRVHKEADPILYLPFESTTAILVDTEEALEDMLEELLAAKEVAIDLEHHDQRSYIGIVSLMQISTRNKDWIVDTLKPWRRKLQCLNQVFADPRIVKVLHGAFMDIMWLQRDLGLYVVGLFDTHYASRALGYTGGSLAFLLKKFIDFDAQKQYQTADWRIRPLPAEMFDYARSDTHFLLYIYDNMRNELIQKSDLSVPNHEKDKLHDVLVRSRDTALQTYQHPIYDAERGLGPLGWHKLLSRTPVHLSAVQFAVFRAVHQWRDQVAREQDDSVHYVMANHNVFSIAKEPPADKVALFNVAQPLTQTVRLRADELMAVIRKASQEGESGPDMTQTLKEIDVHKYGEPTTITSNSSSSAQAPPAKLLSNSVSAALKRATPSEALPIRSDKSSFWGSAFESSAWQQKKSVSTLAINLSVPLPPLTAEIFADTTSTPTQVQEQPRPAPPPMPQSPASDMTKEGEVFTLKERNRKRKSDAISTSTGSGQAADGLAIQADEVTLSDPEQAQRAAEKAARKAARKAEKRAKKAEVSGVAAASPLSSSSKVDLPTPRREREKHQIDADVAEGAAAEEAEEGVDEEEEEEFDYAAAPSVLHAVRLEQERERKAKREQYAKGTLNNNTTSKEREKEKREKREKREKTFNPFTKALDAGKGVPRAQKERAGKSMTFRS